MSSAHRTSQLSAIRSSRSALIIAIVLAGLLLSGCVSISTGGDSADAATEEVQNHTYVVSDNPTVDVTGFNGSIEIIVGDDGVVDIETRLTIIGRVSYVTRLDGNTVFIVAKKIGSGISFGSSPKAEIRLTVPMNTVVKAKTSNGAVEVTGTAGSGELSTSNGRITVSGVSGQFDLETSNGRITMSNVDGQFKAHTTNGSIDFSGTLAATSDSSFTTSNGSIDVAFSGEPDVAVDARTSNGSAASERPILATTTEKTRLIGKYGAGSATLELRTSNGSIMIR